METPELLSALAGNLTAGRLGHDVIVHRHFQPSVSGRLLRVHEGRALVIAGFGTIPVEHISDVEDIYPPRYEAAANAEP